MHVLQQEITEGNITDISVQSNLSEMLICTYMRNLRQFILSSIFFRLYD